MAGFDNVDRSSSRGDGNTKTKQESAADELVNACVMYCGAGDDGAHDNEEASNEHAGSPTPGIDSGADEGQSGHTANLVHGGDQAGPNTVIRAMEEAQECLVGSQAAEQRTVKAIHGLAEEAKKSARKKADRGRVHEDWPLPDEGFIVGSAAFDDFDLCYFCLRVSSQVMPGGQHQTKNILTWL